MPKSSQNQAGKKLGFEYIFGFIYRFLWVSKILQVS